MSTTDPFEPYIHLMNMTLATWATHLVVAQKVGEAVSDFYARTASTRVDDAAVRRDGGG
jgi:hypothetical protein